MRHKLDRYDARKVQDVLATMQKMAEYNYTCDSDPLYKKLNTICHKLENLLRTELGVEHGRDLQEEYRRNGKV